MEKINRASATLYIMKWMEFVMNGATIAPFISKFENNLKMWATLLYLSLFFVCLPGLQFWSTWCNLVHSFWPGDQEQNFSRHQRRRVTQRFTVACLARATFRLPAATAGKAAEPVSPDSVNAAPQTCIGCCASNSWSVWCSLLVCQRRIFVQRGRSAVVFRPPCTENQC